MANRGSQAMALTLLKKRITGKTTTTTPSPPRLLLKAFGGYMTIEEYRASHVETEWTLPPPRLITQSQVVHITLEGVSYIIFTIRLLIHTERGKLYRVNGGRSCQQLPTAIRTATR